MFDTPILFLVFNRPDTTQLVFERIRQVKPKYLFVAADGPRNSNQRDAENCQAVRKLIMDSIDWDCEIKTLFRDENLGCGKAVSQAISWFFEQVEEGIILEDDCLPDLSFFRFCSELLEKYRQVEQIMILSGFNPTLESTTFNTSYTFSIYSGIWGWATWKRAWSKYNYRIPEWHNPQIREQVLSSFKNRKDAKNLENGLDAFLKFECDTWDYQWGFYRTLYNGLGVVPRCNLISNIGFGFDATHTIVCNPKIENLSTKTIEFPLHHPHFVLSNELFNYEYNALFEKEIVYIEKSLLKRFISKIIKWS